MHLSDHSLCQIDDAYLRSLDAKALRGLSLRLLADLKEARERLNQGPTNSSRPPSSRALWERGETLTQAEEIVFLSKQVLKSDTFHPEWQALE